MKTSIKYKSAIFLALLLMLALSVSSLLVLQGIAANQQRSYERLLSRQADIAGIYMLQDYAKTDYENPEAYLRSRGYELARQIGKLTATQVVIYDMSGAEIGNSSPGLSSADTKETLQYALQNKTAYQIIGEELYYLAPIVIANNQSAVVQLYYSLQQDKLFFSNIRNLFFAVGMAVFLLSFVLGYVYFSKITNIIYKLKLAVDQIKLGNFKGVPEVKRRDELGDLGQGIFFMSSTIEKNIEAMRAEQQKLTLAVEKLKALEQQQRLFIGNVTHEFKTPLTVVKAYIDLMEMYPEDENLLRVAKENISKETDRLHQMVEKTLQLAALEKYEFELDMQRLELGKLLDEICDRLEGKMQKQGLKLYKDIKPVRIYGDRESMFQIFVNLLDNAIRYNRPKGEIFVKSYIEENTAVIEIGDTGIGIPEDSIHKIFEAFYTVDKNRSREFGGTGLGLALVKQLVEKHKGAIAIKDTGEAGTTFLIKFPLMK